EHVNRTLQKYKGISPTAFINNLRMQRVARLLVSSSSNITEIAFECGFNNLSHFNALFMAAYGVSPRVYRKRQQRIISICLL
ncbi:MAG: AraC family transcriptional regulator, partial [Fibrobacteres bacterium]|nr:AraC family transcriptional regulator [Fibrobacterota bacterium]